MKDVRTSEYYKRIKAVLNENEFKKARKKIFYSRHENLEAFWHIIVAGYPVEFAMKNYNDLFRYIDTHEIEYKEALTTYIEYPLLDAGIYFIKTQWFELN